MSNGILFPQFLNAKCFVGEPECQVRTVKGWCIQVSDICPTCNCISTLGELHYVPCADTTQKGQIDLKKLS